MLFRSTWTDDPVHADASEDRKYYLTEREWLDCAQEVVDRGDATQAEMDDIDFDVRCWGPYVALPTDATVEQWATADVEVARCLDGEELPPTTAAHATTSPD